MTKSTLNRQKEFQRQLLISCGRDPDLYESYAKVWWRNPTNYDSLRLTTFGFNFFIKDLDIKNYPVKLQDQFNYKQLLQLERLFTSPYYLKRNEIVVFSEQDAIMLQLHAGDLRQYLDNLEVNK